MVELKFQRHHALRAIEKTKELGLEWLYENFPKPGGQKRISSTGFLVFEGSVYPVKPLGRLASELAGSKMVDNPQTARFRKHFENLGFSLSDNLEDEEDQSAERQRRLAETWARPKQAEFRRAVFNIYGNACIISDCSTLEAVEAAHILPVAVGGKDAGTNGLPLRADFHRLFDADILRIDPDTWEVSISDGQDGHYAEYHKLSLAGKMAGIKEADAISAALRAKQELE